MHPLMFPRVTSTPKGICGNSQEHPGGGSEGVASGGGRGVERLSLNPHPRLGFLGYCGVYGVVVCVYLGADLWCSELLGRKKGVI